MTKAGEFTRLERNMDTLPIWAPSQYAAHKERAYKLPWRGENAEVRVQAAGRYGQLRWFDKLILTALVQIWNDKGRDPNGWVYFRIIDIIERLERKDVVGGKLYNQIKDSLNRLRGSLIQYQESFHDRVGREWISNPNATILSDLWIVEPKKLRSGHVQQAFEQFTRGQLDLAVVQNLLLNYTRPVSLRFLQTLSERGGLFEAYISSVLYRNKHVSKDIFQLWQDLGLSTAGLQYGSRLASRMKPDLHKIERDPNGLLLKYEFTKSKTKPRSQVLHLYRRDRAYVDVQEQPELPMNTEKPETREYQRPGFPTSPDDPGVDEHQMKVEEIRYRLRDQSNDPRNIHLIVDLMPPKVIEQGLFQAHGRLVDGQTKNAAAYFVGIMKKKAKELGINLPLPDSPETR